jgi:hypothetical protein
VEKEEVWIRKKKRRRRNQAVEGLRMGKEEK